MSDSANDDRIVTVPNVISFLRLLAVPLFGWLIVAEYDVWALVVLALSSFSDWLDGYIARRWNQFSKIGALLDPAADRLYIIATLLGLAYRQIIPWWLVVIILAREVVLGITILWLAQYRYRPLPVHFVGKAGTFALLYAFPLLLLGNWTGWIGQVCTVAGWACALWGVGLYWYGAIVYIRQAAALIRDARSTQAPASRGGEL